MAWAVLAGLVGLPALLVAAAGRPGVRYAWGEDALVVRSGFRRVRFPYVGTSAALTDRPLGARLFGTAVPGSVTGRFSLGSEVVVALATTARPGRALLLGDGRRVYYLTPDAPDAALARFAGAGGG